MKRSTPGWGRSLRASAVLLALLALAVPGVAFGDGATQPATISITAPAAAQFGQVVTLRARLVDGSGAPIANAPVFFTSPSAFFLGVTNDATVAQGLTNKDGLAVAQYEVRTSGWLMLNAEFRGDARYAPAQAGAQIGIDQAARQLYTEHAGVDIPGLTSPPFVGPIMYSAEPAVGPLAGLAARLPRLSGWPIPAALIVVWSLYATAVLRLFHVARRPAAPAGMMNPAGERIPMAGAAVALNGRRSNLFVIPVIAVFAATSLPTMLLAIGARSPYTHANLMPYDPGYTRTVQMMVGAPMLYRGAGLVNPPRATAPQEEKGKALLVGRGCASCHGLKGTGGVVAPPIIPDVDIVRQNVRLGPGAMPVFSPQDLTDADITAIVAYLKSVAK